MRNRHGFTLIEVLVVIVIISIVATASFVVLGDFGAGRKAKVTAEGFKHFLTLVQQKAIFDMNVYGLSVSDKGYETFQYTQNGSWQALTSPNIFRFHAFPSHVVVNLKHKIRNKNFSPDIIFSSSGDISPFQIDFGTQDDPQLVTVTED